MIKVMKGRIVTSGLLALSLFHFIDHLYTMALPPLFPLIKDEFGVGNTEVGLIITGLSLSMILFQLPFGIYSDRVGRRRILIFCLIVMVCSTFLISLSTTFWMILIFQFVLGIGASGYHPVGLSAVADLAPDEQVGSAMSLQAVGGSLGVAFTTGIFLFSGTLAQLIGGKIADRFNQVKIIIGSNLVGAVFLFSINHFQIGGSLIYFAFVFLGFAIFISVPSVLSLVKRVGSQSGYGKAFGINFTIASISGMIAPVIIGYLGDSFSLAEAFNLFPYCYYLLP